MQTVKSRHNWVTALPEKYVKHCCYCQWRQMTVCLEKSIFFPTHLWPVTGSNRVTWPQTVWYAYSMW